MVRKSVIGIIMLVMVFFSTTSIAQVSVGGGGTSLHGLNSSINRYGINLFVELPRSADNTFLLRASYLLPHKSSKRLQDQTEFNGVSGVVKTSYFSIDGGTRFYFFNDYDIGTSMYAGGYIKGILSSYHGYRVDGMSPIDTSDPNDYFYPQTQRPEYSVLFAFGGTVGVKHQLTRGALMFDLGLELVSRLMDPGFVLGTDQQGGFISPLSLHFNLAYRFDWY